MNHDAFLTWAHATFPKRPLLILKDRISSSNPAPLSSFDEIVYLLDEVIEGGVYSYFATRDEAALGKCNMVMNRFIDLHDFDYVFGRYYAWRRSQTAIVHNGEERNRSKDA